MSKVKPIWIKEEEAAAIFGLDTKTLRRYARPAEGKEARLKIATSKPLRKGEVYYNKVDIDQLLMINATGLTA